MNIIFQYPEATKENLILSNLRELKELRLKISTYRYSIKFFNSVKKMQKRNYILKQYSEDLIILEDRRKIIVNFLKHSL